ncbi:transketolase [Rhinolophus ferrumequinum]|uniref:Transketolase n=1 Tax=Rhinolophus ferrumequinum TaxID=59479 RepID=A0A7J7UL97_RHIFE|nr:transketolase [Rhinolophus ferrumequinum]
MWPLAPWARVLGLLAGWPTQANTSTKPATESIACWETGSCRRALCGRPWPSLASTSWTTSSPFLTSTAWARVNPPRCSTSWTSTRSAARHSAGTPSSWTDTVWRSCARPSARPSTSQRPSLPRPSRAEGSPG